MGMLEYELDTHDFAVLVVTWRNGPSGILAVWKFSKCVCIRFCMFSRLLRSASDG